MNISFTKKQEKYIASQVKSSDFQNASEVVRDTLRLHQVYRDKITEGLKAEIAKGWDGPTSKRKIKDIIEDKRKAR